LIVLGSGAKPLRLALKTFLPDIQRGRLRRRTWPPDWRGRRPLSAPKALTPDGGMGKVAVRRVAGFAGVPGAPSSSP